MADERLRYRLGLRGSNAARPHRNRAREAKTGQAPWAAEDFHDMCCGEELVLKVCECGHELGAHECGLCQVVLNEGGYGATPVFCPCPHNSDYDDGPDTT